MSSRLTLEQGEEFSTFKERFYSAFPDLTVFDCEAFNLLKVVLDGLKVDYGGKGAFNPYWMNKGFQLKLFLKRLNTPTVRPRFNPCDALVFDDGRSWQMSDGTQRSAYFHHIISGLKSEHIPLMVLQNRREQLHTSDYMISEFKYLEFWVMPSVLVKLRSALRIWCKIFCSQLHPDDAWNIRCALHKFFQEALVWYHLLRLIKPKNLIFICHYHNEGMIWAAKAQGVKIIELQHGLISASDIFYCMPAQVQPIREKMLMPDQIYTYGDYWSCLLRQKGHEYAAQQIKTLGYYLSDEPEHPDDQLLEIRQNYREVILITTQTKLSSYFIRYVASISHLLEARSACIIIKPHPNEPEERYDEVKDDKRVFVFKHKPLSALFAVCDSHVTIYSTTLYDALRYDMLNQYCLNVPEKSDYTGEIIDAGVASLLNTDELPEAKTRKEEVQAGLFYSAFNFNVTDFVDPK